MTSRSAGHALIVLSAFLYAALAAVNKVAAADYTVMELVTWRSIFGVPATAAIMLAKGIPFRTSFPAAHFARGAFGTINCALGVFIIWVMPLATAQTMCYTGPLWLTAAFLAQAAVRRERPDWASVPAVAAGFAGIMLILRPEALPAGGAAVAAGLATGLFGAASALMIRHLARNGEPGERLVFYYSVASLVFPAAWVLSTTGFHPLDARGLALFAAIGSLGIAAQFAWTLGWAKGAPLVNTVLEFTGIVFAIILGRLFFGNRLDFLTALGIAVVIAACLAAAVLRRRRQSPAARR